MNLNGPNPMRGESLRMMDTAALRALLAMEMETDGEPNIDRIQEISDILAERDQITIPDVDKAWEDFQQNYTYSEPIHTLEQDDPQPISSEPRKKRLKRFGIGLIAAVLIVTLGATISASAFNFDIFKAVAKWTSEAFGFAFEDADSAPDAQEGNMNEALIPLWDALIEGGISDPRLPTYLPEGFEQTDLKNSSEVGFWSAAYESGDDLILIQVQRTQNETWSELQKDGNDPELYVWNGIEFYIMTNMEQCVVTWSSGRYEYYLSGVSEPEMYQMIKSIHKEEPK